MSFHIFLISPPSDMGRLLRNPGRHLQFFLCPIWWTRENEREHNFIPKIFSVLGDRSINSANQNWLIPYNQAKTLCLINRDGELIVQVVCVFGDCYLFISLLYQQAGQRRSTESQNLSLPIKILWIFSTLSKFSIIEQTVLLHSWHHWGLPLN